MSDELNFQPIFDLADAVANYTDAISIGNEKFLAFLPTLYNQTINKLAAQRLDLTSKNFQVGVDIQNDVLVVTINPKDWLANALESGANSFHMTETHLKSPKAKISKEGYRYMVIPLKVWKKTPSAKTETGLDFYKKVKETLKKPKFGQRKTKPNLDGSYTVRDVVQSEYAELKGMERVQQYSSQDDFVAGKPPAHSQFLLFRTMSEKFPEKFVHPGIQARNILKDSHEIIASKLDQTWDTFIQQELQRKGI